MVIVSVVAHAILCNVMTGCVEEAVDNTLFMCLSILRSEQIINPSMHIFSTLDAPEMIVGRFFLFRLYAL